MAETATDTLSMYEHNKVFPEPNVEPIRVEDYASLVKRIAHHMVAKMPSFIQVDDLIQAGMVGLLEAAQKYDGSKGASFETYAGIRIRGAIVDEMRRGDWAPRSVHRNTRRITEAIKNVESRYGRDANDNEIANELGVNIEEYQVMARDSASARLFSYEDTYEEDESSIVDQFSDKQRQGPSDHVHRNALVGSLSAAIQSLPEREQLVLSLYYDHEMNLKEIGEVLSVSESRVSQIHSQAALRLRSKLSDWTE